MSLPPCLLWPLSIVLGILLFGLAVFIHELGHFLVARLLGLRADVFSIGFGPALWKRRVGGTEVRISLIPFGGYVSLPQLDPEGMKALQGDHGEPLPPAAPWKRVLVAVAGPMGNLALAFVCAVLISAFAPEGATTGTTSLGHVEEGSSGWNAGLRAGDRLLAANGNPVRSWNDFLLECYLAGGTNDLVSIAYEREGVRHETQAVLDTLFSEEESIYRVGGLLPGPLVFCLAQVADASPAAEAGLKAGDILLAVDGEPMQSMRQWVPPAAEGETRTVAVRDSETGVERTVTLTSARCAFGEEESRPLYGAAIAFSVASPLPWMGERGVLAQLGSDAASVKRVFKALLRPKAKGETKRAAKGLGGPLMVVGLFIQVVQTGLWVSLGFIRLICVNLALLNLLPLPVLDGGHVVFALYAIVMRREAPPRVIAWLTNIFAVLLIGLMLVMVFFDALRLVIRPLFG